MRVEEIIILILVVGLLAVVGLFGSGYLKVSAPCGQGTVQYLISYYEPNGTTPDTTLATKLPNGSYETGTGRILNTADNRLSILRTIDSGTGGCQCECCPDRVDKPCVEPDPLERYLCADNRVVKSKGECGNDCDYVAVSKIFVCSSGKEVQDPAECGGVVEILYYCSDGRTVSNESACGCSATAAAPTTAAPACNSYFVEKKYKCADGTISASANACGDREVKVYYICSDGRKVEKESDCSAQCPTPAYPASTLAANLPQGAVRIVYECWDGAIANSRTECPLYCQRDCQCPDYEKPVCGSDGRTYPNRCYLGCAGVGYVSDGDCDTYECVETGNECVPPTMTVTALVANTNRTVCCPGLQCMQSQAVGAAYTNANVQQRYTCQPVTECAGESRKCTADSDCCQGLMCRDGYCGQRCDQNGIACKLNSSCCSGYCNQQTAQCDTPPSCVKEGESCRYAAPGATALIEKTCCSGLVCNANGVCAKPPSCSENGASCKLGSECCSQYCDQVTYKCGSRPSCYDTYYPCAKNSDCCSGYCNLNAKECRKIPSCDDSCSNGVRKYSCEFNADRGACDCKTESCDSQRCNSAGTDCASGEQCNDYCSNGVLYSDCYFNQQTGGCTCPTHTACQSKQCNDAGTACK